MKKTAESKAQILAALALALVLGVAVVPQAAFALEGEGDEGIALQAEGEGANAEGDGAGEADGETEDEVSEDVAENIVELYNRIYKNDTFAGYRAAVPLVVAVINARTYAKDTQAWAEDLNISSEMGKSEAAWGKLSEATRTAVAGKPLYETLTILEKDPLATSDAVFGSRVNQLIIAATSDKQALLTQVDTLIPEAEDTGEMNLGELIETAEGLEDYEKFENLYLAVVPVAGASGANSLVTLTAAGLKEDATEAELMVRYNKLALAAAEIDEDVTKGLMKYGLPQAGAPDVETPNTGVNGGIFEGSLDLALVTLIVSAVVATLAGTGVLARLYLHRKF